jgi:hypothetical protein
MDLVRAAALADLSGKFEMLRSQPAVRPAVRSAGNCLPVPRNLKFAIEVDETGGCVSTTFPAEEVLKAFQGFLRADDVFVADYSIRHLASIEKFLESKDSLCFLSALVGDPGVAEAFQVTLRPVLFKEAQGYVDDVADSDEHFSR